MQLKNEEIKVKYGQERGTCCCKDRVVLKIERNSPEVAPVAAATEWPPPRSLKRPRRQRRSNQRSLSSFSFGLDCFGGQSMVPIVSEALHKRGLRASKEANGCATMPFFMAIYDVFPSLNYFLMVIALIVVLCQTVVIIINFT